MTCIVGLVDGGRVYLGADSAASGGIFQQTVAAPKVFQRDGVLFACAGSFRVMQVLEYALVIPPHPEGWSDVRYVTLGLVGAIRDALAEYGLLHVENGIESIAESNLLIGYRGKLYEVYGDFSCMTYTDGVAVGGAGAYLAMGVLAALRLHRLTVPPADALFDALRVAANYCPTVRAPFTVMSSSCGDDVEIMHRSN